jgi:hypothetical protein
MFLFCLAVEPILKTIEDKGYNFTSFADDVILGLKDNQPIKEAITFAQTEYAKIGLKINLTKCKDTLKEGTIEFMG